jgi:hypothetical protein
MKCSQCGKPLPTQPAYLCDDCIKPFPVAGASGDTAGNQPQHKAGATPVACSTSDLVERLRKDKPMTLRVISLGAGVQSTTMALMAKEGEVDCAIFADTGWEPREVYYHLDWLEDYLSFPVYRVMQDNGLRRALMSGGFSAVPFYTKNGLGARQCTYQYKLRPLYRKVRELLGGKTPKGGCEMWVGISTDEMTRMKDARVQYIKNRFPLVEQGMSRNDCLRWLEANGFKQPPRSACLGCPFKRDLEWRATKMGDHQDWNDTVKMDLIIREDGKDQYMHRSCKPIDEVDFRNEEDCGQMTFLSECEGMCGV